MTQVAGNHRLILLASNLWNRTLSPLDRSVRIQRRRAFPKAVAGQVVAGRVFFFSFPSGAGRSLRSLGSAPCGAPARSRPAGPLRGPVPLISRTLGRAGAPARSRRPGRCAARSRSSPAPWGAPARRRGRAGRAAARPGPAHLPHLGARPGAPARSRRSGRCAARSRSSPAPWGAPVRRRGRAGRAAARPGPAHLPHLGARRCAGAVAPAGPLRGPVPLISRTLGRAGAPARSRRPGRCAARSRSSPAPWGAPVRRRGRAGRAAARPGPAHLPHLGARRCAGAVAPAGPLRGPVPLISRTLGAPAGGA